MVPRPCGAPTVMKTTERSRECPACGIVYYPRLAPVVMCLVRRGRSILLARSPRMLGYNLGPE